MGSQEVTSERCAETLLCFVCVNLCAKKGKLLTKGFRLSTKYIRLFKKNLYLKFGLCCHIYIMSSINNLNLNHCETDLRRFFINSPPSHDSPDEDFIRPIRQEDMQRAIEKLRKSKSAGVQEAFMHVPLD